MKIAFILDHRLYHYREAFFEKLTSKGYEIDIFHIGPPIEFENSHNLKQVVVKYSKPFKKFTYYQLPSLNKYSVVIIMQNIRLINLWTTTLSFKRKYKVIHWGIGVSSSKGLQKKVNLISRFRGWLSSFADAIIFYSSYPLRFYSKDNQIKSFIANNTIHNFQSFDSSSSHKDSFLFIGSINERKGLETLIRAFKQYLKNNTSEIRYLNIVGGGNKKYLKELTSIIENEELSQNINFIGPLYDSSEKKELFSIAVACISPKQAGLSVLESFSYGVPFICFSDAISGGEHLNIQNGVNGYLINSEKELTERMVELSSNASTYRALGKNAFEFYKSERTIENMVSAFDDAINFSVNKASIKL